MKQIGIVGGMSWESSAMYYSLINSYVKQRLGGLHSARILLNSVDFAEISQWQHENNWDALTGAMVQAAKQLEAGGADGVAAARKGEAGDDARKAGRRGGARDRGRGADGGGGSGGARRRR